MVVQPAWVAPEVLQGRPYSCAADVHSFGVVLWEVLTGRVPYKGKTRSSILPSR
jgi:serine/threonine protein kinase